ncbi:hypothetical protein N7533_011917 [Penicillium manginii]|jgi:hypothetical protein|uniref:uncharacterized protein n=1 Tax=Penicillium manginii TaxID=203109 RepID=UPI002546CC0A|nr:uncharacterized protein N7533_011917 [Penicillium manginii]KAJ5739133.1 hypothetical protein N7533_011917 [Penicillium manginii]
MGIARDEELEFSTALYYIRTTPYISHDKMGLSKHYRSLCKSTLRRDVKPSRRNLAKWPCGGRCGKEDCDQKFPTSTLQIARIHHAKDYTAECRLGCGKVFKHLYSRDSHEKKSCKKRLGYVETEKPKRARRRKVEAPPSRTSDSGRLDYSGVIANFILVHSPQRLITDEAALIANGLPTDATHRGDPIYRKELVCR